MLHLYYEITVSELYNSGHSIVPPITYKVLSDWWFTCFNYYITSQNNVCLFMFVGYVLVSGSLLYLSLKWIKLLIYYCKYIHCWNMWTFVFLQSYQLNVQPGSHFLSMPRAKRISLRHKGKGSAYRLCRHRNSLRIRRKYKPGFMLPLKSNMCLENDKLFKQKKGITVNFCFSFWSKLISPFKV